MGGGGGGGRGGDGGGGVWGGGGGGGGGGGVRECSGKHCLVCGSGCGLLLYYQQSLCLPTTLNNINVSFLKFLTPGRGLMEK